MLAQIGIEQAVDAVPVSHYWGELPEGRFDRYLLGCSPGTFDAEHPMRFLIATPNEALKLGRWNFGSYGNPRVDELLPQIQQELDLEASQGVEVRQRPDNFFLFRWVRVDG